MMRSVCGPLFAGGGTSREENDGEQPLLLPTEVPATHESGRMSGTRVLPMHMRRI